MYDKQYLKSNDIIKAFFRDYSAIPDIEKMRSIVSKRTERTFGFIPYVV